MMSVYRNRRTPQSAITSNNGFTLMELLIGLAMSTIVLTAIVGVYSGVTNSYTTEYARAGAQQDIRDALALMVQDIRLAGLDPTGIGGGRFITTDATDIEYTADLDYNGAFTPNNNERVRYYLNPQNQLAQILDGDDTTEQVLVDNVTALNFTYLFEADALTLSTVVITMTVQAPAGRQGSVSRTLTERVRIRNS